MRDTNHREPVQRSITGTDCADVLVLVTTLHVICEAHDKGPTEKAAVRGVDCGVRRTVQPRRPATAR